MQLVRDALQGELQLIALRGRSLHCFLTRSETLFAIPAIVAVHSDCSLSVIASVSADFTEVSLRISAIPEGTYFRIQLNIFSQNRRSWHVDGGRPLYGPGLGFTMLWTRFRLTRGMVLPPKTSKRLSLVLPSSASGRFVSSPTDNFER